MLNMDVSVYYGRPVKDIMGELNKAIRNEIEYITGMSVERLSIVVKDIKDAKA